MCRAMIKPLRTDRGTMIQYRAWLNGSLRRTTKRPSCATVATLRCRLTSLAFVIFFDGRVPVDVHVCDACLDIRFG